MITVLLLTTGCAGQWRCAPHAGSLTVHPTENFRSHPDALVIEEQCELR